MKLNKTYVIQAILFILTVLGTTMVGAELILARPFFYTEAGANWADFSVGFYYSVPLLGFLTVHEFGHYITAHIAILYPAVFRHWYHGRFYSN